MAWKEAVGGDEWKRSEPATDVVWMAECQVGKSGGRRQTELQAAGRILIKLTGRGGKCERGDIMVINDNETLSS